MRGNLKSASIRILGLLLLFLITASGVFAFSSAKSHLAKPVLSVETALKAIDFASENDISIDSEFSANLRRGIEFTGRRYSELTNQYFNRNRYYSPALGRFVSKDQIGFFGGANLYRYADNNPIRWVDPTGLFEIDPEVKSYHPNIESELENLKNAVETLYKGNLKEYFLGLINGKNMKLKLMDEGAEGYFAPPDKIYISKSALSKPMKIERLSVLVHEMTHAFVLRDDSWSLSYLANRIIGCVPYPDFFNRMPGHIVPGFTTVQEFFPTFVEENFVTEGLDTINQW